MAVPLTRRGLLGGAGALALCGVSERAHAASLTTRNVPNAPGPYKVLEICFTGGLAHRESLWVESPLESPMLSVLSTLDPATDPVLAASGAPSAWLANLAAQSEFQSAPYQLGAAGGRTVSLGPGFAPIARNPALKGRLRVIATGHDLPVHEEAIALMAQGAPSATDRGRAAGSAATIGRVTGRTTFVLYPTFRRYAAYVARVYAATGRHGPSHAPMLVPYDSPGFVGQLGASRNARRDALSALYTDEYAATATFASTGQLARSAALTQYQAAFEDALRGPAVAGQLSVLSASGANTPWDNGIRRALQAAVGLIGAGLTDYCAVIDAGVMGYRPDDNTLYDMHEATPLEHAQWVTLNVLNVARTIAEEVGAGRLDLDDTMVVFTTEFGRAFSAPGGSHHATRGFAVAVLGGPVRAGSGGLVGGLSFTSADDAATFEADDPCVATGGLPGAPAAFVTPTDVRAGVLLAAGVHPVQPDVFLNAEVNVPRGTSADCAADLLANHLFGAGSPTCP